MAQAAAQREAGIARQAAIENCKSINELNRKIYITLADFDVPQHEREKFRPTKNCEIIP